MLSTGHQSCWDKLLSWYAKVNGHDKGTLTLLRNRTKMYVNIAGVGVIFLKVKVAGAERGQK